jgi:hypothetical protein
MSVSRSANGEPDQTAKIRKYLPLRRRRSPRDDPIENAMHVPPMQLAKFEAANHGKHVKPETPLDLAGAPKAAGV